MAKTKVLLIEDDRSLTEVLRYNLDQAGYQTYVAHDGQDGIAQAQAKLPDIILLDLMLPVVDGLDVCRRLKNDPLTRSALIVMPPARRGRGWAASRPPGSLPAATRSTRCRARPA